MGLTEGRSGTFMIRLQVITFQNDELSERFPKSKPQIIIIKRNDGQSDRITLF